MSIQLTEPRVAHSPMHAIVVGDEQLATSVDAAVGRALAVDDYLDALGHLANKTASVIIGRLEPMVHRVDETVRALRALAPRARLLLVVDGADEREAMRAVRLGFDDYLVRPVTDQQIAAALGGEPMPPLAPTRHPSPIARTVPPELAHLVHDDDDLVEQVLWQRSGVTDTALERIVERLGDRGEGLRWSPDPEPGARACCEVRFENQPLGFVSSDQLDASELQPHADWMARWLMLARHIDHLNDLALRDELTGVWNRRYYDRFLTSILQRARHHRFTVTVMVYDIDDFKQYNDRYGHAAGDEILRETARLMMSVVRTHDVVARIGGDEFAVIFWDADAPRREDSKHPASVRGAATRFQKAVCEHRFPKLAEEAPGTLTISGGLASYPWDGQTPHELMHIADEAALQSKRSGKNAITFGPGAMRICGLDKNRDEPAE